MCWRMILVVQNSGWVFQSWSILCIIPGWYWAFDRYFQGICHCIIWKVLPYIPFCNLKNNSSVYNLLLVIQSCSWKLLWSWRVGSNWVLHHGQTLWASREGAICISCSKLYKPISGSILTFSALMLELFISYLYLL